MEKIFYQGISGRFPYRPKSFDRTISQIFQFKKVSIGLDNYQEWVFNNTTITYILDKRENVIVRISGEEEKFIDIEDQITDAEELMRSRIESELERISTKIRQHVKV
ncbi:hypothetical protein J4414_02030 [Candidatus Woesearchaeota archaeon]|nr:hypothetical protein [Candidatus Woesearchaeota archaeon]